MTPSYMHTTYGHEGVYKHDKEVSQNPVGAMENGRNGMYTGSFSPNEGKTSKRLGLERYKSGQVRDMRYTHIPDKSNSSWGVLLSHVD